MKRQSRWNIGWTLMFVIVTGLLLTAAPSRVVADDGLESDLLESLGEDELLDDGLLDGVDNELDKTRPAGDAAPSKLEGQLLDELDSELGDSLDGVPLGEPAGSDVELAPNTSEPLGKIGAQMRTVEQRLRAQQLSGETTELQESIVAELDILLEKLKKQQRKQQSAASGGTPPDSQRSEAKQGPPKPAPGNPQDGNSGEPGTQSTDGVREADNVNVDVEQLDELIKEAWGHLPETAREQLRQSRVEKFLPKYELLIEKVYRRMAAQQDRLR